MGQGLFPEPHRVSSFLDTVRLAPAQASSTEHPYLPPGGPRLSGPCGTPRSVHDVRDQLGARFAAARDDLPVRSSELAALLDVLEYCTARRPSAAERRRLTAEAVRDRDASDGPGARGVGAVARVRRRVSVCSRIRSAQ